MSLMYENYRTGGSGVDKKRMTILSFISPRVACSSHERKQATHEEEESRDRPYERKDPPGRRQRSSCISREKTRSGDRKKSSRDFLFFFLAREKLVIPEAPLCGEAPQSLRLRAQAQDRSLPAKAVKIEQNRSRGRRRRPQSSPS